MSSEVSDGCGDPDETVLELLVDERIAPQARGDDATVEVGHVSRLAETSGRKLVAGKEVIELFAIMVEQQHPSRRGAVGGSPAPAPVARPDGAGRWFGEDGQDLRAVEHG